MLKILNTKQIFQPQTKQTILNVPQKKSVKQKDTILEEKIAKKRKKGKERIYGFYHVAAIGGRWRFVVNDQVRKITESGLYDKTRKIFVGVLGDIGDYKFPPKFKIAYQSNNFGEYEFPTLRILKSFCESNHPCKVWYIHTKGVSIGSKDGKAWRLRNMWRVEMEDAVIVRNDECIKALNDCDTCGLHLFLCPLSGKKYYAGNFWWASSEHIKKLPPIDDFGACLENRYWAEGWIGTVPHNPFCLGRLTCVNFKSKRKRKPKRKRKHKIVKVIKRKRKRKRKK